MDMSTRPLRQSSTLDTVHVRQEHVDHVGPGDQLLFRLPEGTHIVRTIAEVRDLTNGLVRVVDTDGRPTDHQPRAMLTRITHHR